MHIGANRIKGDCVLQWPIPLPDETLYSLVARVAKVNGTTNALALCNALAKSPSLSVMDCRLDLDAMCSGNGLPEGIQSALIDMTSVRVAAHLAEVELMSTHRMLGLAETAQGGLCRWRICPRCAESDITQFGVVYWHRQHQLPASLICADHGEVLERFDIGRAKAHERLFLPLDLTDYPVLAPPEGMLEQHEFWLGLATLGADALNDMTAPYSSHTVHRSFKIGMQHSGLLTRSGLLRKNSVAYSFAQKLSGICWENALPRADSVPGPEPLLSGVENSRACKPLIRLLLVYWLFGSWGAFKERCRWEDALRVDGERDSSPAARASLKGTPLDRHRLVCLEYKVAHENPTRAAFLKAHQRSHRWLLNNDRQWLDNELPLPLCGKIQLGLFD